MQVMRKTLFLTRTAIIAALYASITLVFLPISFGAVQFRVSEALTILPLFYLEAVPGLAIGCLIANIANGPMDMIIGSVATLLASTITYLVRKLYFGVIPPIIINALMVPIIFLTIPEITSPYLINVVTVGIGEAGAVLALGIPLFFGLKPLTKKYKSFAPTRLIRARGKLPLNNTTL